MKRFLFLLSLFAAILLAACGGNDETTIDSTVDKTEEQTANDTATDTTDEEAAPAEEEVSEVVVDDANVTITYKGTVVKEDDIFGKTATIKFQVVNNLGESIEVQASEISADNVMVDDTLVAFSETVATGKTANANLDITEMEGYDFPTFNENIELTLNVINGETWETIADYPVSISVKQ